MAINLNNLKQHVKKAKLGLLLDKKGNMQVTSLLGSNTKLDKSNAVITGLTLAPFKVINLFNIGDNVNYCVNGDKCFKTCLFNQSGRYAFNNIDGWSTSQLAAVKRTILFNNNKDLFFNILKAEIALKVAQLDVKDKLYIRLNVMSDIDFTDFKTLITKEYKNVVFYDYTKRPELVDSNYAFSIDKTGISFDTLKRVIKHDAKISAIVSKDTKKQLLKDYSHLCIDGDKHDLFFKEKGLFTLLAPKGLSNKQKSDLDKNMTVSYDTIKTIIASYNNLTKSLDVLSV